MILLDFLSLFILIAGFIIGLGAVVVIDIHGFLARRSNYWTLATTRSHKITKPLIWIGMIMVVLGGILNYSGKLLLIHITLSIILILNGLFLSFFISPFLIKREKEGLESELLSKKIQKQITISFILSIIGWWSSVGVFVYFFM